MTAGRWRRTSAGLAVGAALLGATACGSDEDSAQARPSPVALSPKGAPSSITLGVVVSLTSSPGEGSEWNRAAEGAAVAAYRFREGGTTVRLVAVNDKGTAQGGAAAVDTLASDQVSGIVLATSGDHTERELEAASDQGIPVVLPYPSDTDLPADAWVTGATRAQSDAALAGALRRTGATHPVLVDAGGGSIAGLPDLDTVKFAAGDDPAALARRILPAAGGKKARADARTPADAVVVSGPAELQAQVVAAVQGRSATVAILLTPDALSPGFAGLLDAAGGSAGNQLDASGVPSADSTAMSAGSRGASASAYFAALRAAAGSDLEDYFDGEPFADVAWAADTASHDAVVALVDAAAAAGSTEAGKVSRALEGLRVRSADGAAAADLHLTRQSGVAASSVVGLQSTLQDPGLRPGTDHSRLSWFAAGDR